MEDKTELKDTELEKVSGGSATEDAPNEFSCGSWIFAGHISKYAESHRGEMLYLVSHDGDKYYYGELLD